MRLKLDSILALALTSAMLGTTGCESAGRWDASQSSAAEAEPAGGRTQLTPVPPAVVSLIQGMELPAYRPNEYDCRRYTQDIHERCEELRAAGRGLLSCLSYGFVCNYEDGSKFAHIVNVVSTSTTPPTHCVVDGTRLFPKGRLVTPIESNCWTGPKLTRASQVPANVVGGCSFGRVTGEFFTEPRPVQYPAKNYCAKANSSRTSCAHCCDLKTSGYEPDCDGSDPADLGERCPWKLDCLNHCAAGYP